MPNKVARVASTEPSAEAGSGLTAGGARQINWRNALCFLVGHLLASLALFPWFFSWTGVVLCIAGFYAVQVLGINICYHRLLTHRGFSCSRWLERALAILGACGVQDSPAYWVAMHRRHHQFADEASDPHSPLFGFFSAHVGWLLVKTDELKRGPMIERYARDITRDPFHAWLHKSDNWIFVALSSCVLFFAAGYIAAAAAGATAIEAIQFGSSLVVWGGAVRTVLAWHLTWSVNSVSHLWGYRNYETPDGSRNNAFVGILIGGEGWHNNHHADPRSARHGHKWWELDVSWLTIRLLMAIGLARDVIMPSTSIAEALQFRAKRADNQRDRATEPSRPGNMLG